MSRSNKLTINWKLSICTILLAICAINSSGFSANDRGGIELSKLSQKYQTTQPVNLSTSNWLIDKIIGVLKPKTRAGGSNR